MIESVLDTVQARVAAYVDGDPSQALADEATSEAGELWKAAREASPDGCVAFEVVHAIALLHWCRYNAQPEGRDHDDLQVAAVMFSHVLTADPDLVPERLRELIAEGGYLDFEDNGGVPVWAPSYSETQYPSSRDSEVWSGPAWWERRANMILRRSQPGDDPAPVNEAVDLLRRAGEVTRTHGSDRAVHLSNLARALTTRFKMIGSVDDLDEAIVVSRAAVDLVPDDDPKRANILHNLGAALGARFQKVGNVADLDEAIPALRIAVKLTPHDHPYRTAFMTNLGRALRHRYERAGQQSDLDEAAAISEALSAQG